MKVYIQFDFEGVAGFVIRDNQDRNIPTVLERNKRFMKLASAEVSAAATAAFEAGADEVVVWDSHGGGNTLLIEKLPEEVQLITGDYNKGPWLPFFEGSHAGIYIGGHAMDGTPGAVTPHTLIHLNGSNYGEVGMFILECGARDAPVVTVSGDLAVKKEVLPLLPDSEFVVTKDAIGPTLAKSITPAKSCRLIREAVKMGIGNRHKIKPAKLAPPYEFKLQHGENAGELYVGVDNDLLSAYRTFLKKHCGYDKGWPEYHLKENTSL